MVVNEYIEGSLRPSLWSHGFWNHRPSLKKGFLWGAICRQQLCRIRFILPWRHNGTGRPHCVHRTHLEFINYILTGLWHWDETVNHTTEPFLQVHGLRVILQHNNTHPHVARVVPAEFQRLEKEILSWPVDCLVMDTNWTLREMSSIVDLRTFVEHPRCFRSLSTRMAEHPSSPLCSPGWLL